MEIETFSLNGEADLIIDADAETALITPDGGDTGITLTVRDLERLAALCGYAIIRITD